MSQSRKRANKRKKARRAGTKRTAQLQKTEPSDLDEAFDGGEVLHDFDDDSDLDEVDASDHFDEADDDLNDASELDDVVAASHSKVEEAGGPVKVEKGPQWAMFNLLRTRSQITVSILAGVTVSVLGSGPNPILRFGDLALFLSVLLGVASVLALVASITFGFLLHHTQAMVAEKRALYGTFREGVKDLRSFLRDMHEQGLLTERYDYEFGRLDQVTLKDFPLLGSWGDIVDPLLELVKAQEELLDEDDFGRLLRGVAYRINVLEEAVDGLFRHWLGQIIMTRVIHPVMKAFWALAVLMLVILLAPLTFDLVPRAVSWGVNTALGYLTFVLLVELTTVIRVEMKEYEVRETKDDAPRSG